MRSFILLLAACLPGVAAAQTICPVMNAATAGGLLEGPADLAVTKTAGVAACEFTRRGSAAKLRIEVVTMSEPRAELAAYKAQCTGPAVPLKSIGTDAVACSFNRTTEQVTGRVRNEAFLIRISGAFPPDALRKNALSAAELVAGNLF
jgi:hypothetical protein